MPADYDCVPCDAVSGLLFFNRANVVRLCDEWNPSKRAKIQRRVIHRIMTIAVVAVCSDFRQARGDLLMTRDGTRRIDCLEREGS